VDILDIRQVFQGAGRPGQQGRGKNGDRRVLAAADSNLENGDRRVLAAADSNLACQAPAALDDEFRHRAPPPDDLWPVKT